MSLLQLDGFGKWFRKDMSELVKGCGFVCEMPSLWNWTAYGLLSDEFAKPDTQDSKYSLLEKSLKKNMKWN